MAYKSKFFQERFGQQEETSAPQAKPYKSRTFQELYGQQEMGKQQSAFAPESFAISSGIELPSFTEMRGKQMTGLASVDDPLKSAQTWEHNLDHYGWKMKRARSATQKAEEEVKRLQDSLMLLQGTGLPEEHGMLKTQYDAAVSRYQAAVVEEQNIYQSYEDAYRSYTSSVGAYNSAIQNNIGRIQQLQERVQNAREQAKTPKQKEAEEMQWAQRAERRKLLPEAQFRNDPSKASLYALYNGDYESYVSGTLPVASVLQNLQQEWSAFLESDKANDPDELRKWVDRFENFKMEDGDPNWYMRTTDIDPHGIDPVWEKKQAEQDLLTFLGQDAKRRVDVAVSQKWEDEQRAQIISAGGEELLEALIDTAGARANMPKTGDVIPADKLRAWEKAKERVNSIYDGTIPVSWNEYAERVYNRRKMTAELQWAEDAAGGVGKSLAMTVASTPGRMTGIWGYADVALQKLQREVTGSDTPIDYNTPAQLPYQTSRKIADTFVQNVDEATEGWVGSDTLLGNVYSGAAQLGTSMLDSLAAMTMGGAGVVLLGGSAANHAMMDAKERGASDTQALAFGAAAGLAEYAFEKIGLDNFMRNYGESGSLITAMIRQGIPEMGEELGTSVSNNIFDWLINGGLSRYQTSVRKYMLDYGMTHEEAVKQANRETAISYAQDALGGLFSGFGFGAGGHAVSSAQTAAYDRKTGKYIMEGGTDLQKTVVNAGLERAIGTESRELAEKLLEKQKKGKNLTNREIGSLMRLLSQDVIAEAEQRETVEDEPQRLKISKHNGTPEIETETAPPYEGLRIGADTYTLDVENLTEEQRVRYENAETETERTGILYGASEDVISAAQRLSQLTGRDVVFYHKQLTRNRAEQGKYSGNKIWINTASGSPLAQIFSHELTHSIQQAGSYSGLSKAVFERMTQMGKDIAAERNTLRRKYSEAGEQLSDAAVDQELVAEFVAKYLLTDEAAIRDLVTKEPTLGEQILALIDRILARLGNKKSRERDVLRRARNLYAKALAETRVDLRQTEQNDARSRLEEDLAAGRLTEEEYDEAVDALEEDESQREQFSIQRTKNMPYQKQMDAYFEGNTRELGRTDDVFVMGADEALSEFGLGDKPFFALKRNIKKSVRAKKEGSSISAHGVDESTIRNLPNLIKFPALVIISDGRVSVIAGEKINTANEKNVPLLIGIDPNSSVDGKSANEIKSIYGRENFAQWLELRAKDSKIMAGDERKASALLRDVGIETTEPVAYADDLTQMIIDHYALSVNEQFSLDDNQRDTKQIADDLRRMLNNGASAAELRRYVDSIDGRNQRSNIPRDASPAERIVRAAHRQGLSVEEYLQQNWELYDVDGELNEDAREALELEQGQQGNDVRTKDVQYSMGEMFDIGEDSDGTELSEGQKRYFAGTKAIDSEGRLMVLYHQTNGEFTVFDPRHRGAGTRDEGTPFGIFLKSSDADIGLSGKKQMKLYAKIENPLVANNREDLMRQLRQISSEYDEVVRQHESLDREYSAKVEEAKQSLIQFITQWRKDNPDASRTALYDVPDFNRLFELEDNVVKEWTQKADELSLRAKEALTQTLRDSGYDGIILRHDKGSWGRSTDAYIALDSQQVKRTDNLNPTEDPDIQYDIGDAESNPETARADQEQSEAAEPSRVETLPAKARGYLEKVERKLTNGLAGSLSVPFSAKRDFLKPIVRELSEEYMKTGAISQETVDRLFDTAYESGIVSDREFYDRYKHVKDYLRSEKIAVPAEVQDAFDNFTLFRKSAFGTLRIVNEGGMTIHDAYQKLHEMAPDLFPATTTGVSDRLRRMYDIGKSIRIAEKKLDEYHGDDAATFRTWERKEFEGHVGDILRELRTVRQYAEDRAAKEEKIATPQTVEEAEILLEEAKKARKAMEKAAAKHLLTDSDEMQVSRLLRGEIVPEMLDPETDNVDGIVAVYEAKRAYEDVAKIVRAWKREMNLKLREEADQVLGTANHWKDKKGWQFSKETMERNIRDIVPDQQLAEAIIATYFTPVHAAVADATRLKKTYRDMVQQLGLSRKIAKGNAVSESHAVQLLGEALDNIDMMERAKGRLKERDGKTLSEWRAVVQNLRETNPNMNWEKVYNGVQMFREIYDQLFRQMNQARVRNGYEPVSYRHGYFPHFQPGNQDGIMGQFGKALGITMDVTALPTTINGLTHTFRPGIRWMGNALERVGFDTAYDALEGFDKYIESVADVICLTDSIHRLRAFANQIRYRTGDEGLRKQVDRVRESTDMTEHQKELEINHIYENGKYALSNFVVELEEYTNLLANKKSRADRNMEQELGRESYNLMKTLEGRVAANMVAVNPASWLTNFIPLVQGNAILDRGMLLRGMWETLKAYKLDDGLVDMSVFLTNRRGSDPIVKTWQQDLSAKLSKPMEFIDCFTADSLVRARYLQNIKHGMSEAAAMEDADAFASSVMADRSKGSTPTFFNRSNPLTKVFTQFQLEVNNQLRYLFKDIPRETRDKGLKALAAALIKFFLGAFLYNEVYEFFVGRRPALDPIGILNDTIGDATGYQLPNLLGVGWDLITGQPVSFKTESKGGFKTAANLVKNVAEEIPFIGGILGGGRVPIGNALPNVENLGKAFLQDGWPLKKRISTGAKEVLKPIYYLAMPFGGGQIKKIFEGIKGMVEHGSYTMDKDGNKQLQYPIYTDTLGQTFGTGLTSMLFGKTSLPTGREWVESEFKTLTAAQTAAYLAMLDLDVAGEDAYALVKRIGASTQTDQQSERQVKASVLQNTEINEDGKVAVYYSLIATEKEVKLLDQLADSDADMGAVVETMTEMLLSAEYTEKKMTYSDGSRDALRESDLSIEEKKVIYDYIFGSKQDDGSYSAGKDEKIELIESAGMTFDQFLEFQNVYNAINDSYDNAKERATEFSRWVDGQDLTDEQKDTARDVFKYFSFVPAEAGRYDSLVEVGLDSDTAYDMANELDALQPEAGKTTVSQDQKIMAIWNSDHSKADKVSAIASMETDTVERFVDEGVSRETAKKLAVELAVADAKNGDNILGDIAQARIVVNATSGKQQTMDALHAVLPEDTWVKVDVAVTYGATPKDWVEYKERYAKKYGNQGTSMERVESVLDGMQISDQAKASLWQIANKSWKPKNNPYSSIIGAKVQQQMN